MSSEEATKKKQLEDDQAKLHTAGDGSFKEQYEYRTIPPDGGYGWVITLAAMVVSLSFSTFHLPYFNQNNFLFSCAI